MKMSVDNFITSSELGGLRTKEFQMETGDSLFIIDRLEEQGTLRAHEYIGGCLCVGPGYSLTGNAPLVAEISIMRSGRTLRIDKTFHEHGHAELIPLLIGKVLHFAEFYGYGMEPLNLCGEGNHNIMNDSLI